MNKSELLYSKDGKVVFNKDKHFFKRVEDDVKLDSVTGLIKKLEPFFDVDAVASMVAAKRRSSVEEVKAEWKQNNKDKSLTGTILHNYLEDSLDGLEVSIDHPIEKVAEEFLNDFYSSERLVHIESEMLVYNKGYAGFIDNVSTCNDEDIVIIDYKTNEVFDDTYYDTFNPPYNQIGASKVAKATIQLNLLKKAYEKNTGNKVKYMYVLHITEEGYRFIRINNVTKTVEFKSLLKNDFRRIELIAN